MSGSWHSMINIINIANPILMGKELFHGQGDASNEKYGGYGMYLYNGAIWHNSGDIYTPSRDVQWRCVNGSIIELILDLTQETIDSTTSQYIQDKVISEEDKNNPEFIAFPLQFIVDDKIKVSFIVSTEKRSQLKLCQFRLAISMSKPDSFRLLQ